VGSWIKVYTCSTWFWPPCTRPKRARGFAMWCVAIGCAAALLGVIQAGWLAQLHVMTSALLTWSYAAIEKCQVTDKATQSYSTRFIASSETSLQNTARIRLIHVAYTRRRLQLQLVPCTYRRACRLVHVWDTCGRRIGPLRVCDRLCPRIDARRVKRCTDTGLHAHSRLCIFNRVSTADRNRD
jgi:hypothetical protein